MTATVGGGPIRRIVSSNLPVEGNVAVPVYIHAALPAGAHVLGGPAMLVHLVTDAELRSNGGAFVLSGNPVAMPVQQVSGVATAAVKAIPVYDVTGKVWPQPQPAQGGGNVPALPDVASSTRFLDLQADASEIATLSDGTPIPTTWHDASGLGHDFTRGVADGVRPTSTGLTKQTDTNGKPYIQFNGTDDWMLGPDFADNLPSFTLFIVALTSNQYMLFSKIIVDYVNISSIYSGWSVLNGFSGVGFQFYDHDGTHFAGQDSVQTVNVHLLTVELVSLSEAHVYLEGVRDDFFTNPPIGGQLPVTNYHTTARTMLGMEDGPNGVDDSGFCAQALYAVMLYTPAPNPTDRAAIEGWLAAKYGITL